MAKVSNVATQLVRWPKTRSKVNRSDYAWEALLHM